MKADNIASKHEYKNRFQNIYPCKFIMSDDRLHIEALFSSVDDNVVPLTPIKGEKGSDYINASYVNVSISLVLVIY